VAQRRHLKILLDQFYVLQLLMIIILWEIVARIYDNDDRQWITANYIELRVAVYRKQWTAVNSGRLFWRRQSVFFVCVWNISETAERICVKFTNSHGRCVWSLASINLKVKVKCQRSRSLGTKKGIFSGPFGGLHAVSHVWQNIFTSSFLYDSAVC